MFIPMSYCNVNNPCNSRPAQKREHSQHHNRTPQVPHINAHLCASLLLHDQSLKWEFFIVVVGEEHLQEKSSRENILELGKMLNMVKNVISDRDCSDLMIRELWAKVESVSATWRHRNEPCAPLCPSVISWGLVSRGGAENTGHCQPLPLTPARRLAAVVLKKVWRTAPGASTMGALLPKGTTWLVTS